MERRGEGKTGGGNVKERGREREEKGSEQRTGKVMKGT